MGFIPQNLVLNWAISDLLPPILTGWKRRYEKAGKKIFLLYFLFFCYFSFSFLFVSTKTWKPHCISEKIFARIYFFGRNTFHAIVQSWLLPVNPLALVLVLFLSFLLSLIYFSVYWRIWPGKNNRTVTLPRPGFGPVGNFLTKIPSNHNNTQGSLFLHN